MLHDRPYVDPLTAQLYPSAADAAHVEQVVHQPDEVADLTFQRLDHVLGGRRGHPPDDLDRVADRRQRTAQLMGQHCEELVLAAVGLGEGFLYPLALGDVERGADMTEILCRRR